MGLIRDFIDPYLRFCSLMIKLKRSDYNKLQMIADDLNEHSGEQYLFTPEIIASRVMKIFIDEAYSDSTKKIVRTLLPDEQPRRRRQ